MAKRILVVDDELRLRSLLRAYLSQEGFEVTEACNGQEALQAARLHPPDLIVLDIMMPEMDGLEFMRQHRKERDTPVIMLTARVEELDRVLGLELGADDYVTKPFSPRLLVAHIRAVLRRCRGLAPPSEPLRAGDILLDPGKREVQVARRVVTLTRSEFDLLETLMSSPGRVFTRSELLARLQGDDGYERCERTVDVHVTNLRAKIEAEPRHPRYVETVYGVGYRFAEA